MRLLAFLLALLPVVALAQSTPPARQAYPTPDDHGTAVGVVPMGLNSSGFAVPCGSASVVYGCGGTSSSPTTTIPSTMTYATPQTLTVATTSGTLWAAGAYKQAIQLCTLPNATTNVWLNLSGGTAAINSGVPVRSGGGCTSIGTAALPLPTSAVTAITDGASAQTLTVGGG